jgi:very-short-patch-repair endonuclease
VSETAVETPLTPPSPPLSGGEKSAPAASDTTTPSPDKGRVGEGLPTAETKSKPKHLPYNPRLTELARANRKNPTPAETLLWQKVLRAKQFAQHKFHRQKPIGPYVVDFYCADLLLVIEIDGDSHAEQIEYDAERTAFLNRLGLRVLRYTNFEILNNLPGVFDDLSPLLPS